MMLCGLVAATLATGAEVAAMKVRRLGGTGLLRGRPRRVTSQASELHKRKIGITPFDCPRDNVRSR
jgi:hypothetical protein